MARLFHSGFELGQFGEQQNRINGYWNLSYETWVTSPVHSGAYAIYLGGDATYAGGASIINPWIATPSEIYWRIYVRWPSTATISGTFRNFARTLCLNTTGPEIHVRLNANGTDLDFQAYDAPAATYFGSVQTISLARDQWHRLEVHAVAHASAGGVEWKWNGGSLAGSLSRATWSGITWAGVSFPGKVGEVVYYDDLSVNDTSGSYNNSWPGEGAICHITPSADQGTNNWTPYSAVGGVHASCVAHTPPNSVYGSSTRYLETTSKTSNVEDRWTVTDMPAELDTTTVVNAVQFGIRAGSSGSDGATSRPGAVRVYDAAGNNTQVTQDWGYTALGDYWSLEFYPFITLERTITTGLQITKSYVDGLNLAAIDANTSTRSIRYYQIWGMVEYVPPSAPVVSLPSPASLLLMRPRFYRRRKVL